MNSETFEALSGVKIVTLVCAFIGAAPSAFDRFFPGAAQSKLTLIET